MISILHINRCQANSCKSLGQKTLAECWILSLFGENEQLCFHLYEEPEGSLAQGGLQLATALPLHPPKGLHPRRVPPAPVPNN